MKSDRKQQKTKFDEELQSMKMSALLGVWTEIEELENSVNSFEQREFHLRAKVRLETIYAARLISHEEFVYLDDQIGVANTQSSHLILTRENAQQAEGGLQPTMEEAHVAMLDNSKGKETIDKELIQKLGETAATAVAQRTLCMVVYRLINDLTESQAAAMLGVHKNTIALATARIKAEYGVSTNSALLLELLADKQISNDTGVWLYTGSQPGRVGSSERRANFSLPTNQSI